MCYTKNIWYKNYDAHIFTKLCKITFYVCDICRMFLLYMKVYNFLRMIFEFCNVFSYFLSLKYFGSRKDMKLYPFCQWLKDIKTCVSFSTDYKNKYLLSIYTNKIDDKRISTRALTVGYHRSVLRFYS